MIALAVAALLSAVVLPRLWVWWTLKRHGADRPDLPGTGGELARHLLDRFGLVHVKVEPTERGDHYDPQAKAVRLGKAHLDGRSVAAAAVAAHEVGHALQDQAGERMLATSLRLARLAGVTDRIAGVFFVAAPLLAIAVRAPAALLGLMAVGVALLAVRVVVNLVTLPVEYDASFSKALPILRDGRYLGEADMPALRSVLRAAALTYLASALISLVNLARWIRLLR